MVLGVGPSVRVQRAVDNSKRVQNRGFVCAQKPAIKYLFYFYNFFFFAKNLVGLVKEIVSIRQP